MSDADDVITSFDDPALDGDDDMTDERKMLKLRETLESAAFEMQKVARFTVTALGEEDLRLARLIVTEWGPKNCGASAYYARTVLGCAIEAELARRTKVPA